MIESNVKNLRSVGVQRRALSVRLPPSPFLLFTATTASPSSSTRSPFLALLCVRVSPSVDPLRGRYGRLMRVILAKRPNSAICSLGDHGRPPRGREEGRG